jgi:hypothetical protein
MFIKDVVGVIRVLLLDPSGFSMHGNLSLANRTRAFYTYFLSFLMYNFFCRAYCAITSYPNFYLFEKIVRNYGRFEIIIRFPMRNIKHHLLTNK